jgi:hypothetical protein
MGVVELDAHGLRDRIVADLDEARGAGADDFDRLGADDFRAEPEQIASGDQAPVQPARWRSLGHGYCGAGDTVPRTNCAACSSSSSSMPSTDAVTRFGSVSTLGVRVCRDTRSSRS